MMYWSTVVRLRYIMIGHERVTNTATVMVWYSGTVLPKDSATVRLLLYCHWISDGVLEKIDA